MKNKITLTSTEYLSSSGNTAIRIAILTCNLNYDIPDDETFLKQLKKAITHWVNENPDGQKAWEQSCEEFSFGNLYENANNPELRNIMGMYGIYDFTIEIMKSTDRQFAYDQLLVDTSKLLIPLKGH